MAKPITLLFLFITICGSINCQNEFTQSLQLATQKMNSGQLEEAIKDLEVLIADNPEQFGAWSTLGLAYRRNNNYEKSAETFAEALKVQPENPQAMFNAGVAYALVQNIDRAFAHLMDAKKTNAVNMTNIGLSPAHPILMEDPRYKLLYPSPDEYAEPFTETEVEFLQDWHGENANDQFGWVARNIGDVSGDGIMDVVTSAPTCNEGAPGAGKIYVYSGRSGALLWSFTSKDTSGQLGMSIDAAGDVNGDGIPDVVAGAPYVNKTWVFSGKDGKVLHEWTGGSIGGAFGVGVKGAGDVNHDGHSDIIIGEPFQIWGASINNANIDEPGNAYLYSGKDGSILAKWTGARIGDGFGTAVAGKSANGKSFIVIGAPSAGPNNGGQVAVYQGIQENPFFTINADSTGSNLGGMFLSVVGDVDADGTQDIYASDWGNNANGNSTGRAYIHSGANGSNLYTFTGENPGDGFGIGIGDAGDIDKDGYDDLAIGSWQYSIEAPSGGKIYVYSGKSGKLMRTVTCKVMGETFGFDVTGLGDVNKDGKPDLLVTSAWSAINGTRSGRVIVVSGK